MILLIISSTTYLDLERILKLKISRSNPSSLLLVPSLKFFRFSYQNGFRITSQPKSSRYLASDT